MAEQAGKADGCSPNNVPLLCRCLQVFVLAVFFHKTVSDPATAAAGLFSAVLGLVLFLDGLRLAVMPMAMQVTQLRQHAAGPSISM